MKVPLPPNEPQRLKTLQDYGIMDTPPEREFDDITALAAEICETPVSQISLVDEFRQWFKSKVGLATQETSRDEAFCAHALTGNNLLLVPDALLDKRFADNPSVTGDPRIRFYAGAPLITPGGETLGTLCVIDRVPRQLTERQQRALRVLSEQVMAQMQLRRQVREQALAEQALRQSVLEQRQLTGQLETQRARLIEAQAVAKVGSWETDLATMAVTWSEETYRIFETSPDRFRPTHPGFLALVHPNDRAAVDRAFTDSIGQHGACVIEHRLVMPDGRVKSVEERWQVFFDDKNRPTHATGTCQDITERKQATNERDRLFNLSLDMLSVAGFDGRLQQVSPAWTEYLGWSAEELTSRPMLDYIHPEDHAATIRTREHILQGKLVRGFENRYRCKDGSYRWLSWNVHPLTESRQVFGVARDVTENKRTEEALRTSETRLRTIVENEPECVKLVSVDGRLLEMNPAGLRMIEADEGGQVFGRPVIDLVHPADREAFMGLHHRSGAGETGQLQFRVIGLKQTERWMETHSTPLRDPNGTITSVLSVTRDITERKRAEQALQASEERFRLLAKATNDAIWDWDLVTNALWWNEGYEKLFGYRREAVDPSLKSWTDHIHPEDLARVKGGVLHVIENGGEAWTDEYRFQCKDGSYAYVLDRGHLIRDAAGKAVRMIGGMTDLTVRRQAEERIAEQAALIDQARDAILVRNLEHRILFWNKGAERLYGWTATEAAGRPIHTLIQPDSAMFQKALEHVLRTGEWSGEIEKATKTGAKLTLESRWTLLRDAQGQPKSILTIDTDITERKKLEQQFLRAQRMESIGTLAGGIAHDLNNLLAPIMMGVGLLKQYDPTPQSLPVLDTMERSAKRGADLVKQVLSFARGVEGTRVALQLRHIIQDILSIAGNTFPKNITVETDLAQDLWLVLGDATQLNQVLLNLCVNARDAMPNGGRLELVANNVELDEQYAVMNRSVAPGRYVAVKVTDSGIGIPKEIIDRIFEPFFTTKELGNGTGLGLSTVLGIVRSHGGFVNVYSEPGKGSTFTVYLPAQPDGALADDGRLAEDRLPRGQGELILVVDDETSILHITKQTLETFGYQVVTAEDGAQAIGLYALHRDKIAVVLTDMMMPVMDGPALIAALRRINPKVRIIAASGLNANANMTRVAHVGVQHFLAKPYSADTMLSLLKKVIREGGSRTPL